MRRESSEEIDEAAARWAARIDAAPTPANEDALQEWLGDDPRRLGAYARARAALSLMDGARALGPGYDPQDFLPPRGPQAWSRRRLLAVSGSALAAAGIGAVAIGTFARGRYYSTAVGEMRRVTLADGSVVALNTDSAAFVRYSDERREVRLERGEALFEVAKDRARPFVVLAGNTQVAAVGTAFAVRRRSAADVTVLVREGVVDVARAGGGEPVRLTRDMRAEADGAAPLATRREPADAVNRALSWQEGKIALNHNTLAEAAAEFARYSEDRIEIPDAVVAQQRISGLFVATDPDGFAEAVALGFGLRARREGAVIRLTAS